jgi:threonine dehydrogenase-like Zn-dependent dehydrogenase
MAGDVRGKTVGILGAGPIGLCVGLVARTAGAAVIFMTDKIDGRVRTAARETGAEWTGNPLRQDVVADILEREPGGLDVVFECCGKQEAMDQAVEILRPGGTLALVGIPLERRVSFDISRLRRRELRLQNVRRQNQCMGEALRKIEDGALNVDFLATHTFSLAEAQKAFDTALNYRDGVLKALIRVGPQ